MRAYERLLNYVKYSTSSDENSTATPTTESQFLLADALCVELDELGLENVRRDGKCYVYATLPATVGYEKCPTLGFIAHMDTSPDFSGENVSPVIHENYNGEDVKLGDSGRVLRVSDFPTLKELKGRTLITTDGNTLLGADDKAGISEIMTMLETVIEGEIPHGRIVVGFTPDEEVGAGADYFDVEGFGADFAYTVDGGREGEVSYENFNAAGATVKFAGVNVHPGSAKDVMVNASLLAFEFNSKLPQNEIPSKTEERQGFFHLTDMQGDVESATLKYIIRDHGAEEFDARCKLMESIAEDMKKKYGESAVSLTVREQYRNMIEKIEPHMHLIDTAIKAAKEAGVEPTVELVRGGTDGARLSFMGLPCPNLGTGGYAFHGPFEHITAEGMDSATDILINIVREYAENK